MCEANAEEFCVEKSFRYTTPVGAAVGDCEDEFQRWKFALNTDFSRRRLVYGKVRDSVRDGEITMHGSDARTLGITASLIRG